MSRRLIKRYLTNAEEYVCPLSEDAQKIAANELRETPSSRSQALEAIRNWLVQNSRITCVRLGNLFFKYGGVLILIIELIEQTIKEISIRV